MAGKFATVYARPAPHHIRITSPSCTRQEFASECNLNEIMRRYAAGLGGVPVGDGVPFFGDVSCISDYQAALDLVTNAQVAFDALPSDVRKRFDNDPARLVDFLADERNRPEAEKLGLVSPAVKADEKSDGVKADDGGSAKAGA